MAVFRVERNKGYTVMSNHHLRNRELTLKAKGLLSQMLSLPEAWDYTLAGLSHINREKIDAIREAVRELERAGYIQRSRERDDKGRLRGADYVIFEQPQPPTLDLPTLENPTLDNPTQEKPTLENPTQLNKELSITEKSKTDISNTHSIPIHSPRDNHATPMPLEGAAATPPERNRTEPTDAYRIYEEIIKDNIEYDILAQDKHIDVDRLDEIVTLILETVCTARKTIRVAGDDYPAEVVKSKFMKLDSSHITKRLRMNTLYCWLIAIALLLLPISVAIMPFMLKLGYYPSFILFMLGIIPIAAILMLLDIFVISKVQRKTPNENLGKVMAIIMAVAQCAAPIGQVIYGVAFETFHASVYLPVLVIGVILLVMAGVARRSLKNEGGE